MVWFADDQDHDSMVAKWSDGTYTEVPQVTVSRWKLAHGHGSAPKAKAKPKATAKAGNQEPNEMWSGDDGRGNAIKVFRKKNFHKKARKQWLVCCTVNGKQLLQVDRIYFDDEFATKNWMMNEIVERVKTKGLTKDEATELKVL